MIAKAQVKTQAKTPVGPTAARLPQPLVAESEHEADRPAIAAQLEAAARLGHSLGAVRVDGSAPPIIQRQEIPEEEEEELQMKREPAAVQRQELPEEEEELMLKRDDDRVDSQGGQVPPDVEAAIRRARGSGQPLDGALQRQMSAAMGHDFSRVRVHTDAEADLLNQQLQAKAFTAGADIFFRHGAYEPGSSGGRELIAHELSHVVQQGTGRVRGSGSGMTVQPAGDAFEEEADAASRSALIAERKQPENDGADDVAMPYWTSPADILALQRTVGNRGVQRLLAQRRRGDQSFVVDDGTARRIVPARGGGQPGQAVPTAAATIQRAALYRTGEESPLEKGSIVVCHNPSPRGHRMVMQGGEAWGLGVQLTHAAIVGEGGATRIEAMGGTVEENAVKGGAGALDTEVHDGVGIPAGKGKIHEAARASVGKDRYLGVWWAYDRAGALAAVEKGRLEGMVAAKREYLRELQGEELEGTAAGRLQAEIKESESRIAQIRAAHPYPALVQDVEEGWRRGKEEEEAEAHEAQAALAGERGDAIMALFHRRQAERLRAGIIKRPTARTWCVQFVVQAVQAAMVNEGQEEGQANAFAEAVGRAPHVRDLYDAGGFAGHWQRVETR